MDLLFKRKFIRVYIMAMIFISLFTIQGIEDQRQAHQIVLMLSMMGLFSLVINNIYITLFMLWTIFLYSFFKFQGPVYLSNIFFGCILYFIVKCIFKKEHINTYINWFLWFVFFNLSYMVLQVLGYDFIYQSKVDNTFPMILIHNTKIDGFMGHRSIVGSLLAFSVPILFTRGSLTARIGSLGLLIVLWFCNTSLCLLMGFASLLFVSYFYISRRLFLTLIIPLVVLGSLYLLKVDRLGTERIPMWKQAMSDYMKHPITGYGLDSFGNVTQFKNYRYSNSIHEYDNSFGKVKVTDIQYWDNPHNLIVSLFYEFGAVGIILFIFYMRENFINFIKCIKNDNSIALTGFVLVFLGLSLGHFPIFLAREVCFIIPFFALWEVQIA